MFDDSPFSLLKRKIKGLFIKTVLISDEELEAVAAGKDQGCGILRSSLMGDRRDGGRQVTW